MAQLGSNQSDRRKDNGAIVFWVKYLISTGHVINFFHVTSDGPIRKQQPQTAPQVPGSDRTVRPEVNKKTHLSEVKIMFFV